MDSIYGPNFNDENFIDKHDGFIFLTSINLKELAIYLWQMAVQIQMLVNFLLLLLNARILIISILSLENLLKEKKF